MVEASDNLVLQLLREIRSAQVATDDKIADIARGLRAEMKELRDGCAPTSRPIY